MEDLQNLERIQWNPVLPLGEQPALELPSNIQDPAFVFLGSQNNQPLLSGAAQQQEHGAGFKSHPSALQEGDAFLPGSTAWDKHSPQVFAWSCTFRN